MNKDVLAIIAALVLIVGALLVSGVIEINSEENSFNSERKEEVNKKAERTDEELTSLIDCLKEEEVVIYGSYTCPACTKLIELFGGSEVIEPIYVECMEEGDVCDEEKLSRFVPEIQIDGEVYKGGRSPKDLAEEVGCEF